MVNIYYTHFLIYLLHWIAFIFILNLSFIELEPLLTSNSKRNISIDLRLRILKLIFFYNCSENVGLLGLTHIGSRRVVQISCGFMIFFSIFGTIFHLKHVGRLSFQFLHSWCNYFCFFQGNLEPFLHRFPYRYLLPYTVFYLVSWVGAAAIIT